MKGNLCWPVGLSANTNKMTKLLSVQVILWTLDNGNTINSLELDNSNSECYYFERLERVLATQVLVLSNPSTLLILIFDLCQKWERIWFQSIWFVASWWRNSAGRLWNRNRSSTDNDLRTSPVATPRTTCLSQRFMPKKRKFTMGQITNKTQNRTTNGQHKQGGSEKEIYAPEEGADTGLFASVLQVLSFILVLQVFCCSFLSFSHILALYFVKG